MTYYVLPKNNNLNKIEAKYNELNKEEDEEPCISFSLYNYVENSKKKILKIMEENTDISENYETIVLFNSYIYQISKLNIDTILFYDLLEIKYSLNLFENKTDFIKCLHYNLSLDEHESIVKYSHYIYNNYKSIIYSENMNQKFDFILLKIKNNLDLFKSLFIVLKYLNNNENCVVQIESIYNKITVEFIYILTSLFKKIYITKPNTNNIKNFEKYIVCKGFIYKEEYTKYYIHKLHKIIEEDNNKVVSILNNEIPVYFINKLNEINIIIGQQELEVYNQIINLLKFNNKEEKIELIKKNNIQKCIYWCSKYLDYI